MVSQFAPLSNLFASWGWTRDDAKWVWMRVLSVAALLASGMFNLQYWAGYIGVGLSEVAEHRIIAVAALVLWIAGTNSTSKLPGDPTKN